MTERPYILRKRSELFSVRELLEKEWIEIPFEEFFRITGYKMVNFDEYLPPDLQTYYRSNSRGHHGANYFLYPLEIGIQYLHEWIRIELIGKDVDEYDRYRFEENNNVNFEHDVFYLKEDVEKLNIKYSEYRGIFKCNVESSVSALETCINTDLEPLRAEVERLQARVDALQKDNATLQATVDKQARALEGLPGPVVADAWRKDWGFLDDVIKQIENGLSRKAIAEYLQNNNFSRAIIGAVTSQDKARVEQHSLRTRTDTLLAK